MTPNAFDSAIYQWLASIVSPAWALTFGNQDSPRPGDKFITITSTSVRRIGGDVPMPPNLTTGIATMVGNREWRLSLEAFGVDAMAVLYDVLAAFNRTLTVASLRSSGIIYVDDEGVLSTAELFGTTYEERAALDVLLRTDHTAPDVVLESVGVSLIASVNLGEGYRGLGVAIDRLELALNDLDR